MSNLNKVSQNKNLNPNPPLGGKITKKWDFCKAGKGRQHCNKC